MRIAGLRRVPILLVSLLLGAVMLAGCRSAPAAPGRALKLLVTADGVYEATESDLAAAGFPLRGLLPEQIVLSTGGQPVAFQLARQGRETVLRFYGQALGLDGVYGTNVYWLTRTTEQAAHTEAGSSGQPPSLSMQDRPAVPSAAELAVTQVVPFTLLTEEERQYRPLALPGEPKWIWRRFSRRARRRSSSRFPTLPQATASSSIHLVGNSSDEVDPDHHLLVKLNGQQMSDSTWDGTGPYVVTATVPPGMLSAGENTLSLSLPGDTGRRPTQCCSIASSCITRGACTGCRSAGL